MTASTGSNPRAMGYDGENRPLWVARAGKITCYVYGADGTRLKKIEGVNDNGPATNRGKPCTDLMPVAATLPAGAVQTVTFNQVEVRKWGTGNGEVITTYPHPNIRLIWAKGTAGLTSVEAQALHRDQLGSVRAVTTFKPLVIGAAISTLRREAAIYKPFGEQTEVLQPTQVNQEQKGWIGERYDADAGLQYLNARYYDPELGFFLQPDWFEVTAPGVGTNRYSYAGNDPVNARDPGGNEWYNDWDDFKAVVSAAASATSSNFDFDKTVAGGALGVTAGAIYGGTAGVSVGCGASACVAAPATGLFGAGTGAFFGGIGGLGLGFIGDLKEALGAGARAAADVATSGEVLSTSNQLLTAGSPLVIHGNSSLSPRQTELYTLRELADGTIAKYGVTSESPSEKRYNRSFYEAEGVRYRTEYVFSNRYAALLAENLALVGHYVAFGQLPRLNRGFR